MDRRVLALAALGWALAACSDSPSAPSSGEAPALEPVDARLSAAVGRGPDVQGRFIVTLEPRANPGSVAREHGVQPDFVYNHALNGFAGKISDAARAGLLRDNRVVRVEADGIATIVSTTETGATWGLDRVDQRSLPLSTTFTYTSTGSGVTAYIIDTGLRLSHAEFGGRAVTGYDAVTPGGTAADCNGHGTHVGGTVGGGTYGVAKGVSLVAVRVLDCGGSGTWSGVIAGMDWVTGHHAAGAPAVANLSLGGGANSSVDDAVRRMIADGVVVAVAAGNGNAGGVAQDACKYSPARVAAAMTIGATNKYDRKASWSNYGSCVDWFAPGVSITSAWYTGDAATGTISGTSMATPHTAGVAALYLQNNPGATPSTVRSALYSASTKGIVTYAKSANNHLLFTNY
jgi:subtilisin family serine protease